MIDLDVLIPIIIVIAIIQLTLIVFAVRDWLKQDNLMPNRTMWIVAIFLLNFIGPILYFMIAPRNEQVVIEDDVWTE